MLERTRYGDLKVTVTGDKTNERSLMKTLEKAKARFTRIRTIPVEEGSDKFDVECYVANKKFWKIYPKLSKFGDLTID